MTVSGKGSGLGAIARCEVGAARRRALLFDGGRLRDNDSKGGGGPSLALRWSASSAISINFGFASGSLLDLPPFLKKFSHYISVSRYDLHAN